MANERDGLSHRHASAPPRSASDALLAGLLFAGTVVYWWSLPHSLGPADESVHLYEAKRILDGEVLYRDVFNFITPGWFYLIAGLFWAFGTSIETARMTMAIVHGLTAALVYLSCRRLGVRRALAWLAALAYLAICQSAFPIVSQHWISTFLCGALLFVCVGRRHTRAAWALLPGIVLGLLISVQQQRGVFMAAAVAVWLVADAAVRWWYAAAPRASAVLKDVAFLGLGVVLIVGPVLGIAVINAGFAPVWNALVIFPLFNYRSEMSCAWGAVNLLTGFYAQFTSPAVLKYSPAILLLSSARVIALGLRRRDLAAAQGLLLLLIFSAASALSIAYFPDFIKISFIAFVFFVAAAENLEWVFGFIPGPRLNRAIGWTTAAMLLVVGGRHLYTNLVQLRRAYPVSHATAFGRVDYASEQEAQLRDQLAGLLAQTPSRSLYGYPILADLYLTVPADNPTPYGFFFASGYHSPEQIQQVIDILAARQLPYIVALPGFAKPDDPVFNYILQNYEPISAKLLAGRSIYRRKPAAP